ncbi:MAG: DNA repair protein RecN [Dehalococcoidia bacterium]|nr:DNA repair protein RecN [Dehalococcoidia bacterium]
MLSDLRIKSFGIINELTWRPGNGLNVITGETGSGKSLVIDAVESLLSGKIDEESIRYSDDAARIEAVFFLSPALLTRLRVLLEEKGVPAEEDYFVAGCEIRRGGRAVLRINSSAVSRALVRETGEMLVDIHSQSQHLSLFNPKRHLDYLDAYAHTMDARAGFAETVLRLYTMQEELGKINMLESERLHRQEMLRYQSDEIKRAGLRSGEEEELTTRRRVIASAEKLKSLAYQSYQALNGDDSAGPALSRLGEAVRMIDSLLSLDPSLKPQAEALRSAQSLIEEAARDLRRYEDSLEYDQRELEEIEARLSLIHDLKKKYGGSPAQIIERHAAIEADLAKLESLDEQKITLGREIAVLRKEAGLQAEELSARRRVAASGLTLAMERELTELNMAQVRFEVRIEQRDDAQGIPYAGRDVVFNRDGADAVEFMVSTNPGEPLKPLAEIASTGEVSRFTLALKAALAEADATPVLVFDEIDIGVGGRSGEVIGRKLWSLSRRHQVICVTHLPQIAAYADLQFNVSKGASGARTGSAIVSLEGEDRVNEIAAMLGGSAESAAAVKAAREILQKAAAWQEEQKVRQ